MGKEKEESLSQMVGKLAIHRQKNAVRALPYNIIDKN